MNMGSKDYGMLIGDKIFWLALIMIVVMGVGYLAIGTEGAIIFGGIIMLIMTFNGFIPKQYVSLMYVPAVAIIMLLVLRAFAPGSK